jgi:hypothetical protein
LQTIIGDDALHGTDAEGEVGLAQLLGDDLRGGFRIQEPMAQDLPHHFVGAAVVGLGAGFLRLESGQAALLESLQKLIEALSAIAVFVGHSDDVGLQALAFQEHEEAPGQGVLWSDGQRAGGAGELVGCGIELKGGLHGSEDNRWKERVSNKMWQ